MGRGGQKPAPPGSPGLTSRRWSKGEDLRPHTPQEYDDDLNNLWVVHGRRYDLAPFRESHPGGATALDLCRGSDATRLFDGWRGLLSVLGFIMSVAFVTVPFFRFDTLGTKLLFALGPYVVTSAFFFTVTQISHVQAECQRPDPTKDFFQHQARTSLDYGCTSEFWRFATGGLNVQSIHHVMPVVNSCHYAKLYPEFYALCEKYNCAPATEPHILSAGYRHLKHVYDLGELYRGPDYSD